MLFSSKKPTDMEAIRFESDAHSVMDLYSSMAKADNLDVYLTQRGFLMESLDRIVTFQKKYPGVLKGKETPIKAAEKIKKERLEFEKAFVDRYIKATLRKAVSYKTEKGRKNHINHANTVFMFSKDEFLPETVKYFQSLIQKLQQ